MPHLVAPNQVSFMPSRKIQDNIILTQVLLHSMRQMKGKKQFMAIKVDLEKAYDRLNWEFIKETLLLVGFDDAFVSLIMSCVSSSMFQVLWNGDVTSQFTRSSGIQQGDPSSLQNHLGAISDPAVPLYSMQSTTIPFRIIDKVEKVCRSFLWGDEDEKRKLHMIGWEEITRSKNEGGLGLKNLRTINLAFLTKVGCGMLTDNQSLWAQVMKAKYIKGGDLFQSQVAKPLDSPFWKAICKIWTDILFGMRWIMGDGKTVSLWVDDWVPHSRPLLSYATDPESIVDIRAKVQNYTTASGDWILTSLN
ncbi:Ribonuclease H protein [Quillaja saponaria]|uniref:Ribonuclease H protein n=1 Tax=Quillaja saponaria TaxID=32244 RepID=A0AAD7VG60_QUISA|nr:Ribonuclease H protein [Quillaja saponaria]